ncbi:C-type lectin 1-like isoform X2 [Girardinichthys multiradiatus]|uniref:C-type lectin 1-like isoform X2 n=1 Tax=Girardinichthys multiradiatus TaxID=208333 RepID=UPI001FAD4458|nr:C-type lectin 1-like isoform X2 [Girardinichthys multiradiatus]
MGNEKCAGMTDQGLWFNTTCEQFYNPICSDGIGTNVTFVLINLSMNWPKAQNYCREHHTDLVTIRDPSENQKVKELVPAGKSVWIGLHKRFWNWVDGSNPLLNYWKYWEPTGNTKKCAATFFELSGKWEDLNCELKRAFICYQAPLLQEVLKVKLLRTAPLDLEDPTVLENMLKQLERKLQEQRVNLKIKLSWRKQTDGKIFHKEEQI